MTATDERDRVLGEVAAAHPAALTDGLAVLERWARTGERFSANDVRSELHAAGVTGPMMGALFTAARRAGIIRPIGAVPSTDLGTHRKAVQRYIAGDTPLPSLREQVVVAVRRDPAGRFHHPDPPPDTPTLF